MARTTATAVTDILTDSTLAAEALDAHIEAATAVVDDVAAADASIAAARLELIERYLAAHFATVQEPRVSRESVGSGDWEYSTDSQYIDVADSLDPTGIVVGGPAAGVAADASIGVPDGRNLGDIR